MVVLLTGLLGCGRPASSPEPFPFEFLEEPAGSVEALPMIVAIHGNNGHPERMMAMARSCGLRARLVAPQAPRRTTNGWSWFDLRTPNPEHIDVPEAVRMADLLSGMVRRLGEERPTVGRPVITGFSQGGILSYTVSARSPEVVSAAVPVSGVFFPSMKPEGRASALPPIRALQPERDPQIPLAFAKAVAKRFADEGADIELKVLEGVAHGFGAEVRPAWCAALASVLPG